MTATFTIRLVPAADIDGKKLDGITLREPTIGEFLRATKLGSADADAALVAFVAGVADYQALARALTARAMRRAILWLEPSVQAVGQIGTGDLLPAGVTSDDDLPDTLAIPLADTIQIGTTWIDHIELHEPTGLDLIKFRREPAELPAVLLLVCLASGQPRMIIERLPVSVFARAAAYALGFIAGVPKAGKASLPA